LRDHAKIGTAFLSDEFDFRRKFYCPGSPDIRLEVDDKQRTVQNRWEHLAPSPTIFNTYAPYSVEVDILKVHFKELTVSTNARVELVDLTQHVSGFVRGCSVESGICLVNSLHSTTAIIVNEPETGLMEDVLRTVRNAFPQGAGWLHDRIDNNADAHLASVFLGHSKVFPIKDGRLSRGTWQSIFLLELDGPRTRRVICEVIGK
jgi:secondary thiamine-phosphate synthase enzyme